MDIYRFINSTDIREHLRTIGYVFNSLETAWLIWQCRTASLTEKHAAWQELIDTMPDCVIPKQDSATLPQSLHSFLRKYMKAEKEIMADFYEENKSFVYTFFCADGYLGLSGNTFSDFTTCINAYKAISAEFDISCYTIRKRWLNGDDMIDITFLKNGEPLNWNTGRWPDWADEILWHFFDWGEFYFPTPFKTGDILCQYDEYDNETSGFGRGPFVMTAITPEHATEHTHLFGDESDMNAWGYFQAEDGTIYKEVMSNYMDLEYYRGKLDGKKRILKALSNHIKGDIDITLFANAYHHILCDEYAKTMYPRGYNDKGLWLAGLKG